MSVATQTPAQTPAADTAMQRGFERIGWFLAILAVIAMLPFAFYSGPDFDELQMLRNSLDIHNGLRLYIDFWDNHAPLYNYVLAPLFGVWPQDNTILLLVRVISFATMIACGAMAFCIHRLAFPAYRHLASLSAALVLFSPPIVIKGTEARADSPMTFFWMLSLLLLVFGIQKRKSWAVFAAGLAMGFVFGFSVKVLLMGAAVFLLILGWLLPDWKRTIATLVLYGAGFGVIVGLILFDLHRDGLLSAFQQYVLHDNIGRERRMQFDPFKRFIGDYIIFALLSLWVFVAFAIQLVRWRIFRSGSDESAPAIRGLWAASFFLFFTYFFLLPTQFMQSLLPFPAPVAPLMAIVLYRRAVAFRARRGDTTFKRAAIALTFVAVVLNVGQNVREDEGIMRTNIYDHMADAQIVQAQIAPNEKLFDGRAWPLYPERVFYHRSIVSFLRRRFNNGQMDFQIPETLAKHGVTWVSADERIRQLERGTLEFLAGNYLPIAKPARMVSFLLVAGKVTPAKDGVANVEVVIPGRYYAYSWPNLKPIETSLDGRKFPAELTSGTIALAVDSGTTAALISQRPASALESVEFIEKRFRLPRE